MAIAVNDRAASSYGEAFSSPARHARRPQPEYRLSKTEGAAMTTSSNEPKGCLAAILSLLGINLGGGPESLVGEAEPTTTLPYQVRDDFLSPAEYSFYRVLVATVGNRAVVCPKVNLNDVFFVARPNENQAYRNKIDRKHVDFLLCHPATMKPLGGVELDDASHQRKDRRERDEFVDKVFAAAGLPLVHVVARASYNVEALAAELAGCLGGTSVVPPLLPTAAPTTVVQNSSIPVCPKCGVPMLQRTASKGANKGQRFWGCQNYPKCREVIS